MTIRNLLFFLFIIQYSYSQDYRINNLNLESIDDSNSDINVFEFNIGIPAGFTIKKPVDYFDFNLNYDFTIKKNKVDITNNNDLLSPTWNINQKFSEGNINKSKFRRDFYLGNIETNSKYIIIKCRDHEYIDGDRIRLMLNGSVIHPDIYLGSTFFVVDVDLSEGYNNIDFIALNEGESSPNTAQLIVLDEFGNQLSNKKWLISTGYKAKLVVFKK